MGKWKIPDRIAIASVWVVWAFLAIGALGWAIQVVVAAAGLKDAPSWVQAIGSVGAIFITWFIGQQQLDRERQRAQDERRRIRLERLHAAAQARRDEAARVFYLANEFDFLNLRINAARSAVQEMKDGRWLFALNDLLSRLVYEPGAGRGMTIIFGLRQEILKLIEVFQLEKETGWYIEFITVFENVRDRVRGLETQANIEFEEAGYELDQFAATGIPGDVLSARETGLIP